MTRKEFREQEDREAEESERRYVEEATQYHAKKRGKRDSSQLR